MQKAYKKAEKLMKEFALLADGNPDVYTEEGDLLYEYMGKMTMLQCKRKGLENNAASMDQLTGAFSRCMAACKHQKEKDAMSKP